MDDNIVRSAKSDSFRLRMNPELKDQLEELYARNGLTLTDAVNIFFQQSLNAGGLPFQVTESNAQLVRSKAMKRLLAELKEGDDCGITYSEDQAKAFLGLEEL